MRLSVLGATESVQQQQRVLQGAAQMTYREKTAVYKNQMPLVFNLALVVFLDVTQSDQLSPAHYFH